MLLYAAWYNYNAQFITGDGKTHYVRKELRKERHKERIVIPVNECFDPVEIIKILRGTQMQRYVALFLNFTLPRTEVCQDTVYMHTHIN